MVSRLTAWLNVGQETDTLPRRRLETGEWAALLDAVAAALTSPAVIGPVADLAGADPITVPQPRVLHLVSEPAMPDLLPAGLSPIRGGGVSHGAHMPADPALDLSEPGERAEQVDRWLIQMAADAGLLGMEQLVSKMRRDAGRLSAHAREPPSGPTSLRSRPVYGCPLRPASGPVRRAPSQVTSRSQAAAAKA
jgi:hypothetical protein